MTCHLPPQGRSERTVTPEELREVLDRPISDEEREEVLSLVRWFTRRYPTGAERLAYVRQAYVRWTKVPQRGRPVAGGE